MLMSNLSTRKKTSSFFLSNPLDANAANRAKNFIRFIEREF